MKNLIFLFLIILMIFTKTGNVLSDTSIFTVNNIEINKNSFENSEELLNKAFKIGFKKLTRKILLEDDFIKLQNTSLNEIKNLVSFYQIVKPKSQLNKNDKINVNLYFKRERIYNFFYKNNIKYSDVTGKEIKIFPVLIEDDDIFIFDKNFFYKKWEKENEKNAIYKGLIDYILPMENLESIEIIKRNMDNLSNLNSSYLFDDYLLSDNLLIVISIKNKKAKIFMKGLISSKKIIKNYNFINKNDSSGFKDELLLYLKKQIFELVKEQNIIDISTPAFLNINLNIKKNNDLYNIQKILNEIDLVENFQVREINNKNANIKIKYYGKTNVISEKLLKKGIKIDLDNETWKVSLN